MARSTVVRHETAVGAFALLGIGILGGLVAVKGTKGALGAREIAFRSDAGHDLKRGASVKMKGIEVGEVSAVSLEPDNQVVVRIRVWPEFQGNLHQDAIAAIVDPPILGSSFVELTPGSKGELDAQKPIAVETKRGLMDEVNERKDDVKKLIDKIEKIADKADATLTNVNQVVEKINSGEGVAGRLIADKPLADELVATIKDARAVLDDMKGGKGAFALLKDEQLAPDLRAMVADVRSMTDTVSRGEGTLGRFMSNNTLALEAEGVLHDVRSTLARLDEITKDTTATTAKVQGVLDSAKGTLDKLDGTIKNAEKVTGELAAVTEKVNKGQGTLAKLVNDDALFRETKALLKELRESVEDLREQAPINSFIGVVFSAF